MCERKRFTAVIGNFYSPSDFRDAFARSSLALPLAQPCCACGLLFPHRPRPPHHLKTSLQNSSVYFLLPPFPCEHLQRASYTLLTLCPLFLYQVTSPAPCATALRLRTGNCLPACSRSSEGCLPVMAATGSLSPFSALLAPIGLRWLNGHAVKPCWMPRFAER